MSTEHTSGTSKPFPRYLMDQPSRTIIEEMESRGLAVEVLNPAVGSVEIIVTLPDGSSHSELGRPEDLAEKLQQVAAAFKSLRIP